MTRQMLVLGSLIAAGALAPASAHATTGLQWQWEGQSRTYQIQGQLRLPEFVWMRSLNNNEARVFEVRLDMVTTCAPNKSLGKTGWEVHCTVDDIGVQAVALGADVGILGPILEEWDGRLTGAVVEIEWTADGRIRNVGFGEMERRNRRDGENLEVFRQLMARAFSGFDLRMPKKGDDKGLGEWTQKAPLVMGFPSTLGTVGTAEVVHKVQGQKGDKLKIASKGGGVLANAGNTIIVAGQEEIANRYEMDMASEAMFDVAKGQLVRREVASNGTPTASSQMADGFRGLPYVQAYRIDLVPAGSPPPTVIESKEVEAVFGS